MTKNSSIFSVTLLLICVVILVSCSAGNPSEIERHVDPTRTPTALIENNLQTSTSIPTEASTNTPVPSPTPIEWPTQAITSDNVNSLEEINSWGRGTVIRLEKLASKEGEYLALTPLGLYWYASESPFLLAFIPDVDDFVLSADGRWMAASKKNGDVEIWKVESLSLNQTISHVFPEDIVQMIEEKLLLPYFVGGMTFSPDGSQLAVGYADGKIEVWHLGEFQPYATLQHDSLALWQSDIGLLYELSFSPENKTLTAFKFAPYINANRLTFWSLPDAELRAVSDAGRYYEIPKTAYLPDKKTLLVFSRDDSYLNVSLWDSETGTNLNGFETGLSRIDRTEIAATGDQITLYGSDTQANYYRQVRALPDGNLIESEKLEDVPEDDDLSRFRDFLLEQGHYDNSWEHKNVIETARLVGVESLPVKILEENYILSLPEETIKPLPWPDSVTNPYYDPQGEFVAWCEPGSLSIVNEDGTSELTTLPFNSSCDGVVVSPQRRFAVIWKGDSFYMLNLESGEFSKPTFHQKWANTLMLTATFSADEQILITSKMALVTVWQTEPFHRLADSEKGNFYMGNNIDVALSEDKTIAASLSVTKGNTSDRTSQVIVWRVQDAFPLHRINPPFIESSSQPMFTSFSLSRDGSLIVTGDDFGGIRFWNTQNGEELAFYEYNSRPLDLAFTPNGGGLVVVLADGTVRLLGVP